MSDGRVSFRAHFERYPATIKGAFVLRAADGVPHQVAFTGGRCVELSGEPDRELGLEGVIVDVAPNLDLFVPFEFPAVELPSGWYHLACEALIDGTPTTERPGSSFVVPWPRGATRRARVLVDTTVDAGVTKVALGILECTVDSVRLGYEAAEPATVRIDAEGRRLALVEHVHDEVGGRGHIVTYPAMRDDRRLEIHVRGAQEPVLVALP